MKIYFRSLNKILVALGLNIKFINSDLRLFSVDYKFDLVLNLFTSFGYFETDEENFDVFKVAFDHLQENGFFVFDYFNSNYVKQNLVEETVENLNEGKITQQRKIEGNRVIKKITIQKNSSLDEYFESVRMFGKDELVAAIENVGFKVRKIFGDFGGSKFDLESCPRIIIIAQK